MIDRKDIEARQAQWMAAREKADRLSRLSVGVGMVTLLVLCAPIALLADEVASGPLQYVLLPVFLVVLLSPMAYWLSKVGRKSLEATHQAMLDLQEQLEEAVRGAEDQATRREAQVQRQQFETHLANALEMADGETEVVDVVRRALQTTLPDSPVEMLLADNSHAHLSRVVAWSPTDEPPGCDVDSPDRCPAARRAQVQQFADSDDLDACPKLRGRPQGRCSAVCVPVSIMGRTVGVIHATGAPEATFSDPSVQDLATLANLAGARIGLLRIMAETELQASTDSLTGLLNRRSLENRARMLRDAGTSYAVVMADLDHFKDLNDTHGHETGDRALRVFAETLRGTLRSEDLVARHGGEEFAVALPACNAEDARTAIEQVRLHLAEALGRAGMPRCTASFGIVEASGDADLADTITRADAALFQAKREGRDRVIVHDERGKTVAAPQTAAAQRPNATRKPAVRSARRARVSVSSSGPATIQGDNGHKS